jgi:hypothetical protein
MTITSFKFALAVFLVCILSLVFLGHREKNAFLIKQSKKEQSYFNSFHVLDAPNRMELYVHTEGSKTFDAELYSTITFKLLDSARGMIDNTMFHDTSRMERLLGFYSSDSIDIMLNSITFQCKQ